MKKILPPYSIKRGNKTFLKLDAKLMVKYLARIPKIMNDANLEIVCVYPYWLSVKCKMSLMNINSRIGIHI